MLRDGTRVHIGQRIARLHFWNEQVPAVPRTGATIGWGRRMQRAIATSLGELASFLAARPEFSDVTVICADAPSGTKTQTDQLARIMARYGFEAIVQSGRMSIGERLHRFGENILISLIILAHNPGALRADTLKRVRLPIYLSRRILEREFGEVGSVADFVMTIAESIPNAVSFALSLSDACVVIAIVGCLFTLAAMVCVVTFPHLEADDFAAEQPVTILKPLHDLEPDLPARLITFCEQDYSAPVQILCGTPHNDSPSVAAVHATMQQFPGH